jgi:hypothetical protein
MMRATATNLVKAMLSALALSTASSAEAGSLQVAGTSGYLSEWELKADVTATRPDGREEYSGPLTLRHVGVCSPNGAVEKSGTLTFRISKTLWSSQIRATLLIDGARCTYNGKMSNETSGFMDCPDGKAIPLTLSMK